MYLFSPQCYQSTSIESLVAERKNYIYIASEAARAWDEYDDCLAESEDGDYVDIIACDHDGLSYTGHKTRLQGIINSWLSAETHIDTLGNKIERLMRRKTRT